MKYEILIQMTFEAVFENWSSISCFKYKSDFTECGLAMSKDSENRVKCASKRVRMQQIATQRQALNS